MAEVTEAGTQRPLHDRGRGIVMSSEARTCSLKIEADYSKLCWNELQQGQWCTHWKLWLSPHNFGLVILPRDLLWSAATTSIIRCWQLGSGAWYAITSRPQTHTGPGGETIGFPRNRKNVCLSENRLCDQEKFCNSLSADGSVFVVNGSELLVSDPQEECCALWVSRYLVMIPRLSRTGGGERGRGPREVPQHFVSGRAPGHQRHWGRGHWTARACNI